MVWQDQSSDKGYITKLYETSQTTVELEIDPGYVLGVATKGTAGEIFYVTFQKNPTPDDKESTVKAFLYRASLAGE